MTMPHWLRAFAPLWLLLSGGCTSLLIGEDFYQQAARNLVVQLDVQRQCDDGPELETGAGVFLGTDDRSIYVATAKHVVLDDDRHCIPRIKLKSHFTSERAAAELVFPPGQQRPWPGLDFELLRVPRKEFGAQNPYLGVLNDSLLQIDTEVQLYGAVHGYSAPEPAHARVSSRSADSFALRSSAARPVQAQVPQPSDSGGAIFSAEDQRLVGLYTGGTSWNALDIHRVIQQVEASRSVHSVRIDLRPPPKRIWWGYVAASLLGSLAVGAFWHAKDLRDRYYEDPSKPAGPVSRFNRAGAILGGLAGLALGYNLARDALLYQEARRARRDWAQ